VKLSKEVDKPIDQFVIATEKSLRAVSGKRASGGGTEIN